MISVEAIKKLRSETGISVAQCKQALTSAGGDFEQALVALKEQGAIIAAKKSDRALGAGVVSSYLHTTGALGALVELDCETDFVAKTADFRALANDLAMHISAFEPVDNMALLAQPFIKDPSSTVADVIKQAIQKFGEKIEMIRFVRFAVGN